MSLKHRGINRYRDYSTLFSRQHANSWLKNDFSALNSRILNYDAGILKKEGYTYKKYLKKIYKSIEKVYQNEYVLKNAFLNQWLKEELGQTNSRIFSEFRVGKSVVDLAIFNGVSRAFEIKSEFDSPHRLKNQLNDYLKLFNEVFIIVPEDKQSIYLDYCEQIGIISFAKRSKRKFKLVRNAKFQELQEYNVVMNILRTNEYKSIVQKYFGQLPKMTSFNQYHICKALIEQIPLERLNLLLLSELKNRNQESYLSANTHKEFNQLSLALKLSRPNYHNLLQSLDHPVKIK